MTSPRSILLLFCLSAITPALAQLNTWGPLYLSTIGAITASTSPYYIPKKVAADPNLLVEKTEHPYEVALYNDAKFAVFTGKKERRKAYQIVLVKPEFVLLCEHYFDKECGCFEGLHIMRTESQTPLRVRKIWPFSLKKNLLDELEAVGTDTFAVKNLDTVCEIIETLKAP